MLQKVLLVEDETDIQQIAHVALELVGGFTVEICSSGLDALHIAADFAPDLILLDVMMPKMDGPTTLHKLREIESTKSTPVIFMTAKARPEDTEKYLAMGAVDVISKPFDPMNLASQVRAIYDRERGFSAL